MKRESIIEIRELFNKYSAIHDQLNRLESELERIQEERYVLRVILDETRESEGALINKLEQELGKKLSPNDLLEIIKTND